MKQKLMRAHTAASLRTVLEMFEDAPANAR